MKKILTTFFTLFSLKIFSDEEILTLGEGRAPQLEIATTTYEAAFLKMILVLVGILSLAIAAFYVFKKITTAKMTQTNHFKNIKILEKRALSPKSILYLVEVGGKKLLIGESQVELRGISELTWIDNEKKGL